MVLVHRPTTRSHSADPGLFGPDSASWLVLSEASVMAGGLRALLMHAAHPLVASSIERSGVYRHEPWTRLQRTLRLTFAISFGTRAEAMTAARGINDVHRTVQRRYTDASTDPGPRDPDLLLWVHACLVVSFLTFERLTVRKLDAGGREQFHQEQALVARLLGVPRTNIPATLGELEEHVARITRDGILSRTNAASEVAALLRNPPEDLPQRRTNKLAQYLAFQSLPPAFKELYGVKSGVVDRSAFSASCRAIHLARRTLPPSRRFIAPALQAQARVEGRLAKVTPRTLFVEVL